MEQLRSALQSYQHLDPHGWVAVYRLLPAWGGLLALVVGVVMLLFGGRRLFRLVASPLGAFVGQVWVGPLAVRFGFGAQAGQIVLVSSIVLAGAGLIWPPVVVFVAFGVPAGLIGGQLVGQSDWILGFGPGFFLGGAIGVAMNRLVGAVLSAVVGGWLATLGMMAALSPWVSAVGWLAGHPLTVLSVAACFALAGGVFQIFVRPSEEAARAKKIEDALARRKAKEQKALEERWAKYNRSAD